MAGDAEASGVKLEAELVGAASIEGVPSGT